MKVDILWAEDELGQISEHRRVNLKKYTRAGNDENNWPAGWHIMVTHRCFSHNRNYVYKYVLDSNIKTDRISKNKKEDIIMM